jgi:hypothetical protein
MIEPICLKNVLLYKINFVEEKKKVNVEIEE